MLVSRILPLLAAGTLTIGGLAGIHAQGFDAIHGKDVVERLMDHIDVSGDVRDALREIHADFVQEQDRLSAMKAISHDALQDAMFDEVFDEQAIRDAAAELAAASVEEFVAQARMMQSVRQLLTPEQYEKLAQAHGAIGGRRGHSHGH